MTPFFTRFLAAAFMVAVCLLTYHISHADDADVPPAPDHVAIPNLSPAGPSAFEHGAIPILYFGVKSCGEYVIWLVFENDIRRIDKDHAPKDMASFMKDLEGSKIPGDVKEIACTGGSL
jgi:hypothetical protein